MPALCYMLSENVVLCFHILTSLVFGKIWLSIKGGVAAAENCRAGSRKNRSSRSRWVVVIFVKIAVKNLNFHWERSESLSLNRIFGKPFSLWFKIEACETQKRQRSFKSLFRNFHLRWIARMSGGGQSSCSASPGAVGCLLAVFLFNISPHFFFFEIFKV